jgi:ribonuclease BN (tRNA processing enzyme)/DNA-binding NarL/FixJ family response regulator
MKKRILIASPSSEFTRSIRHSKDAKHYQFAFAQNGLDCLKKIEAFRPDLILLELHLPQAHGIEILGLIRRSPEWQEIGVIITTSLPMIQNYHASISGGANYFLLKPFKVEEFFKLARRFFSNILQPDAFHVTQGKDLDGKQYYLPKMQFANSYLKLWGTRGSSAVSGSEYVRFGGNTSCMEVSHGKDMIIVDAGTGIRQLGNRLMAQKVKNIHLFLSHTHWDHLTGFPFFMPIYDASCKIHIWAPVGFNKSTKDLFTEMLAYAYFPVRLEEIAAEIIFEDLRPGKTVSIGKIHVDTCYANHPGATVCFKIKVGKKTFGYATDNEVLMGYHGNPLNLKKNDPLILSQQPLIQFFKGCDLLIHEAQYSPQEYLERVGWGHSSISNAAYIVKETKVPDWIVTHHDPQHSDDEMLKKALLHQDILNDLKIRCRLHMAYDGFQIPL